jgi:hypothetical protein
VKKTGMIIIVAAMALAASAPASAQDVTTVNLGGVLVNLLNSLVPVAVTLIGGLATWAFALFKKKTGLDIEFMHRDALEKFLANQAGRFLAPLDSWQGLKIDVGNKDIARLAQEAVNRIPDAIKFFGLDVGAIAQRIVDKVGLATATSIEPKVD